MHDRVNGGPGYQRLRKVGDRKEVAGQAHSTFTCPEAFHETDHSQPIGTRLILDIAQHGHKGPVTMQEIADRQQVSKKYLARVVRPLTQAGYLKTIRGPNGGYLLNKHPKDILVGEWSPPSGASP